MTPTFIGDPPWAGIHEVGGYDDEKPFSHLGGGISTGKGVETAQ
jgi:hypothetical protein